MKLIGRVYSCPWFSRPLTHGLPGTPALIQAARTSGCVSSAVLREAPSAGSGAARGRGACRGMPSPGSGLCRHPREPLQPASCWCRRHGHCAAALRPRDPGGARGQRPPRARPEPARCRRPRAGSRRPPGPSRPEPANHRPLPGLICMAPSDWWSSGRAAAARDPHLQRSGSGGGAPRARCSPPAAPLPLQRPRPCRL